MNVQADTLDALAALVAFDTTSRNSNLALIDWVEERLRALGFRTSRLYDRTRTKANLWASVGPDDVPGYILSGHTDVVPVDGQAWTGDPFRLRIEEGRAYGRGACDMKGFLAVLLALAPDMARAPLRVPLHLAFSYDEEVGCVGAKDLAASIPGLAVRPEACFVGEPTSMRVVIGHKGKRSVRVLVHGHSCHSSLAPFGVNAVEWGALLVGEIRRMADHLAAHGVRDPLYDVPHSTAHVGIFRGGHTLNTVPDRAEIVFEFRTLSQDPPEPLIDHLVRHVREQLEPGMKAVAAESGFAFEVIASYPGLDMAPDAPAVALAKALTGRTGHHKVAYGTEAGVFHALGGVPAVVVGPGSIEQAHKPDEWIALDELESCAAFVSRLIRHSSVG